MWQVVRGIANLLGSSPIKEIVLKAASGRSHHILAQNPKLVSAACANFLSAPSPIVMQTCGFKVKGQLRRRCRDCYLVRRQERMYVICKTHPRHKQMSMVKDEKNTWILTHATQHKQRPW